MDQKRDERKQSPTMESAFRMLRAQISEVSAICNALTDTTDRDQVWRRVVHSSRLMLNADGCTFYSVRDGQLHYEIVLSGTLGLLVDAGQKDPERFPPIPIYTADGAVREESLAARVAASGKLLNVDNVQRSVEYDRSMTHRFDEAMKYRTHSILSVPVRYRDNPVTGVLQFINAHNTQGDAVGFDRTHEDAAVALASLLAVSAHLD